MMMMRSIAILGGLFGIATTVLAQQTLWGQCGGVGYTGPTTCVAGACCTFGNTWYWQCLPGPCTTSSVVVSITPSTTTTTSKPKTSPTGSSATSSAALASFTNPVVYADFADNDVFRGPDNVYYLSASNMHYSPGAPILKSLDLVNWEHIGHSVPSLEWGSDYDMGSNKTAYVRGTWASTMRYRESNKTWYWIGCVDFWVTYIYTASSPTGPWVRSGTIYKCYYDCGLHIDDDDTMYVVYGNKDIYLSQLTADGLSESKSALILSAPPEVTTAIEGDRMYKRNGVYYILNDWPEGSATYIWKASDPWGPWTSKLLGKNVGGVVGGGSPIQGSLVETQNGDWYFMSFTWAYPAGRMPVLAPVTWGSDGFPVLGTVGNNQWGATYPNPLPTVKTPSWTGTDSFSGTKLGVAWEWNHNPDTTKFTVNNGLILSTASATNDLFHARNTLTHRVYGPQPIATVELDFSNMADGDRCGLAAFRHETAYIGVFRSGSNYTINMVSGLMLNSSDWTQTVSLGATVESRSIVKGRVWLRGNMDARADGTRLVSFEYSTDGAKFNAVGNAYTMNGNWPFFMGYRWAIFNYATKALGGSVKVASFKQV